MCALKVVVHVTLLKFFIFLFMCNDDINEKQTTVHGLYGWKEILKIALFGKFAQFTNELDLTRKS